jgi:DUF4097 and DUF4098 domain-containing protein YvlB
MAREKWLLDGPKTIDFELVRTLKVGLIGGQVDIVAHDEPGARVEVHSVTGKPLKVTIDEGVLEIDHPQLGWDNFLDVFTYFTGSATAEVSIMVPRAVALKFGVVSASALITGLTTDARISTVSGEVVIDGVTGDIELNSVSGELSARDHTGRITAHTVGGDVAATGDISRFTCDSVSGDVFLDITGEPDQIRVNTVSGAVTTRLAPGVAVQYRISTASGRLQLDDAEITRVHGTYNGTHGELSQNWLEFRANTVSGNVSVLHARVSA